MNIAIVYDTTQRGDNFGMYISNELSRLGHHVAHHNPNVLSGIVTNIAEGFDLYIDIDDSFQYLLEEKLKPKIWWAGDTHIQYQWDFHKARFYDFVFCAQKDAAESFSKNGIRAKWLPHACEPKLHGKVNVSKKYDIGACCNMIGVERNRLIPILKERYPNNFFQSVNYWEMGKYHSMMKIIVNIAHANDVNMRVFEACCSGSFLICNKELRNNGLYDITRNIEVYENDEDLFEKIDYYLKNESEREKIAHKARKEILAKHTYMNRAVELAKVGEQYRK